MTFNSQALENSYILGVAPSFGIPVTTRIIIYLEGDSYKSSCGTVTGKGPHPKYTLDIQEKYLLR